MAGTHLQSVGQANPRTPAKRTRPKPDPILEGRALAIFEELHGPLELSGRLNPEYLPVFRLFCQTLAVAEKAGAKLADVESEGRKDKRVADPIWRGFRDAAVLTTQLAREFGLTPDSAARVRVPQTPDEQAAKILA